MYQCVGVYLYVVQFEFWLFEYVMVQCDCCIVYGYVCVMKVWIEIDDDVVVYFLCVCCFGEMVDVECVVDDGLDVL